MDSRYLRLKCVYAALDLLPYEIAPCADQFLAKADELYRFASSGPEVDAQRRLDLAAKAGTAAPAFWRYVETGELPKDPASDA